MVPSIHHNPPSISLQDILERSANPVEYMRNAPTGAVVGLSMFTEYSVNERTALSLAVVDPDIPLGARLRVIWGEPDGCSRKTTVEDHQQIEVGVTVASVPYSRAVRDSYEGAWRKKGQV